MYISLVVLLIAGCRGKKANLGDGDLDRNLPGDRYERSGMSGELVNISREQRRQLRAATILARREPTLRSQTPAKLLDRMVSCKMCIGWSLDGVQYYVAREGNKQIERELQRRGPGIRAFLSKCRGDTRQLFTGSAGPHDTIGEMCGRLLRKLGP